VVVASVLLAVGVVMVAVSATVGATVHAMCCALACHPRPLGDERLEHVHEDSQILTDFFVAEATDGACCRLCGRAMVPRSVWEAVLLAPWLHPSHPEPR
jgi:hypothetical protein